MGALYGMNSAFLREDWRENFTGITKVKMDGTPIDPGQLQELIKDSQRRFIGTPSTQLRDASLAS